MIEAVRRPLWIPPHLRAAQRIARADTPFARLFKLITQGGLVNGGVVNAGHAMVNGGDLRAHVTGPTNNPPSPGTAVLIGAWRADKDTYKDTGGTTPATASGDAVKLWKDQSGAGHDLSQSGTNNPTISATQLNSKNTINFVRASQMYLALASQYLFSNGASGAFTIYAVVSQHTNNFTDVVAGGLSGNVLYRLSNGRIRQLIEENVQVIGSGVTAGTLDVFAQSNVSYNNVSPGAWVHRFASAADANGNFGSSVFSATTMKIDGVGGRRKRVCQLLRREYRRSVGL